MAGKISIDGTLADAAKIYERIVDGGGREQDLDLIWDICDNIRGKSFCGLGEGAIVPVMTSIKYFRDEYISYIRTGRDLAAVDLPVMA